MKNIALLLIAYFSISQVQGQAFSITDFQAPLSSAVNMAGSDTDISTDVALLGGELDLLVTSNNNTSSISATDGTMFMGFQADGFVAYEWDGIDNDATMTSFATQIASLGGCGDITINFNKTTFPGSIMDFDMTIEMYNTATQFISWTGPVSITDGMLPVSVNTSLFQETGPTFDFNDLRAMRVIFSTTDGSNLATDLVSLAWVPDVSAAPACDPIIDPSIAAGIPTMGEWGIIILGLSAMVFGLVFIRRRSFLFNREA